ncbi:hypothetical protein K470DRAFT_257154 [Piedraia hortae CBS 480.64]|uniref:Uncharacterized protein n=1 Tax=Piedraia hortae CBS 480.64 TaxID=1314780 RepID=A0A6A7C1S9_9PEZI|nr:hypothetical protein K470DRAFT_257154 [Piedraia hortae CBS 480.64]
MPVWLRYDRGAETLMAADFHYDLTMKVRNNTQEELAFKDCFQNGTSKANQRIEALWGQMSKSKFSGWKLHLEELSNTNQYSRHSSADRIAFLTIYVPRAGCGHEHALRCYMTILKHRRHRGLTGILNVRLKNPPIYLQQKRKRTIRLTEMQKPARSSYPRTDNHGTTSTYLPKN